MASSPAPTINGQVILRARMHKGLTLRDVAQRCSDLGQDVDFSTLARWERGDAVIRLPRLVPVLAKVLDLSVDDLLLPVAGGNGDGAAA